MEPATYWEKAAKTRWGQYTSRIAEQAIVEAHRLAGEGRTALEVGCEGGHWSKLLFDMGWKIICTDVDREVLNVCQQRIPTARCIHVHAGDRTLPCDSSSLGLILCVEVFPVIDTDWFWREGHRTLSTNGLIVGVVHNKWSPRGLFVRAKERLTDPDANQVHYRVPYAHLKRRIRQEGFVLLYERGYCWFPFSRQSNSFLVPIFARLEQAVGLSRVRFLSPWIVLIAQKR